VIFNSERLITKKGHHNITQYWRKGKRRERRRTEKDSKFNENRNIIKVEKPV